MSQSIIRKLISCIMIFVIVFSLTLPAFAADNSSYQATVKYGLNLRDSSGKLICYLKAGTIVQVQRTNSKDPLRVDIKCSNGTGNVLASGLKKVSSSGLSYAGTAYQGKVKNYLNVRDGNNNLVGVINQGEVVSVLGDWTQDTTRVVIEWKGRRDVTVLKAGLTVVSAGAAGGNGSNASKTYYARVTNGVNMRDANGNLICYIPKNSLVTVKNTYAKDKNRVVISFYGIEGNVLKSGVKEVKDAVFLSIYRQRVTLIRNGKLVAQSDCVTGKENRADTPRGAFKIYSMSKNATLRGTSWTGKKYAQPVNYWMPFKGGYGLHDATYREAFGGSNYKVNGSNGCVNLPLAFAKVLYNNAYVGLPVYIA